MNLSEKIPLSLRELIFSYLKPLPFLEEISESVEEYKNVLVHKRRGRLIYYRYSILETYESYRTPIPLDVYEMNDLEEEGEILGCLSAYNLGVRNTFFCFGSINHYLPKDFEKKDGEWIFDNVNGYNFSLLLPQ